MPASGAHVAEIHPDEPARRSDRAKMDEESTTAARRYGTAPPRLSIVVLPFANIGDGPEQEHFVDGVTESRTTDLSRIRGAVVIPRNTAFTYKRKGIAASLRLKAKLNQLDRKLRLAAVSSQYPFSL
jgi:TolB-like protein